MVPNLRFPEFKENWKITTLGECSSKLEYGLGASAIEYDGIHKYIRITDIDDATNQFNSSNLTSPSFFDDNYKVKQNDILFARTGASVGKTYHYDDSDGNLYYAGFLIAAHILKEINSKFVFYNTLSNNYKKWVKIMSARSGQPGINAEEYNNYKFNIPTKEEQDRIALLMEKIDSKIQTQIKIIEDLQLLKKRISTILFDVYSRKCSFYSLEDLVSTESIKEFQVQTRDYLIDGTFEVVDQGKKEIIGYSNDSNRLYTKTPVIIYGDHTTIVKYRDKPFIIGGDGVKLLKAKSGFLQKYIYYVICQYNISSEGYKRHWHILKNILVPVPDYEKQKNIVNILDSFNNKIKNEKKILVKYKKQKDYLLKNMFI